MENLFADKPQTPYKTKASFLPMTLLYSIFLYGSISVMVSTIGLNSIFIFMFLLIALAIVLYIRLGNTLPSPTMLLENWIATDDFYYEIILRCVYVITLVVIFIFVNFYENITIWNW